MYSALRDLGIWYNAFESVESTRQLPMRQDDVASAIELIRYFACFNLNSGFQPEATARELKTLREKLSKLGFKHDGHMDVGNW